ncbi:winged helix-turn-helix domain-containing protein [Clostridium sp.]|uniref:winged helix-turn-helix domain-containing protein n=1 Tax=Clostridium sp. TaxID=1506 RepID=UPI002FC87E76
MGRKSFEITSLHGYSIKELVYFKNTTNSNYSRVVLTVVTMRYQGHCNNDIIEATNLSKPPIVRHIKEWKALGMNVAVDNRGGSERKLEPEMIDHLVYTATNKSQIECGFTRHTWTCGLLSLYIEMTYGIKISVETVRVLLNSNGLSYKRAQLRPTKADKME